MSFATLKVIQLSFEELSELVDRNRNFWQTFNINFTIGQMDSLTLVIKTAIITFFFVRESADYSKKVSKKGSCTLHNRGYTMGH